MQCRASAEKFRRSTLDIVVYLQALCQPIQQLTQRLVYRQSVFRFGGIRKPIRDHLLQYLGLMREDEPQLLLRIGFDNLLDFCNGFGIALADVIEGAARNADLSACVDNGHAVIHALDDLESSIYPRCFG